MACFALSATTLFLIFAPSIAREDKVCAFPGDEGCSSAGEGLSLLQVKADKIKKVEKGLHKEAKATPKVVSFLDFKAKGDCVAGCLEHLGDDGFDSDDCKGMCGNSECTVYCVGLLTPGVAADCGHKGAPGYQDCLDKGTVAAGKKCSAGCGQKAELIQEAKATPKVVSFLDFKAKGDCVAGCLEHLGDDGFDSDDCKGMCGNSECTVYCVGLLTPGVAADCGHKGAPGYQDCLDKGSVAAAKKCSAGCGQKAELIQEAKATPKVVSFLDFKAKGDCVAGCLEHLGDDGFDSDDCKGMCGNSECTVYCVGLLTPGVAADCGHKGAPGYQDCLDKGTVAAGKKCSAGCGQKAELIQEVKKHKD